MTDGVTQSAGVSATRGAPIVVGQGAVPVLSVGSSGATATVSAAGLITGLAALNATYANCFLVLPAGYLSAAGAGSAAGVYYGQGQSTTSVQMFNNLLVGAATSSAIPQNPVAFSGLAGGSGIQVSTAQNAVVLSVPGGMGPNGWLSSYALLLNNNSAGTKTIQQVFGGTSLGSVPNTANQTFPMIREMFNKGVTNAQVCGGGSGFVAGGVDTNTAIDTTIAQNWAYQLVLSAPTTTADWAMIDVSRLLMYPG